MPNNQAARPQPRQRQRPRPGGVTTLTALHSQHWGLSSLVPSQTPKLALDRSLWVSLNMLCLQCKGGCRSAATAVLERLGILLTYYNTVLISFWPKRQAEGHEMEYLRSKLRGKRCSGQKMWRHSYSTVF